MGDTMSLLQKLSLLIATMLVSVTAGADDGTTASNMGFISVLPPLIAISFALIFRQVIIALFIGIWFGAWAYSGMTITGVFTSLLDTVQVYTVNAIADPDHVSIMVFTFLIGGMVGVISKNGGMLSVVEKIVTWANTRKKVQLGTAGMGLAIFFDDYANTLVVGNTMRPVTDRMKVSREKLAYIVDSTAAPIACIALVTTWIGFEVGLISESIANIDAMNEPYLIFLNSIAYSFYPILAVLFVFMIARSGLDFGPMLTAERRALAGEPPRSNNQGTSSTESMETTVKDGVPIRAINAILPIAVLIVAVMIGLYVTGKDETHTSLRDIVGNSNSYTALVWASLLGSITAIALTVGQGIMTLEECITAWLRGVTTMIQAMMVLIMAWALANVVDADHLGTANYLVQTLQDTLPMALIPALVFILAALTAFGTGTSWGTMGILMPLVIPLSWTIAMGSENAVMNPENMHIIYSSVSCVLAGAVWGDHCSPISDTTVLSSLASDCDHVEHVRTQIPYAMTVGGIAILLGIIPTGFGLPWWVGLLLGFAAMVVVLKVFGKNAENPA